MKISAKDAKIGQTVTWGVVTLTIKEIEVGHQKNGLEFLTFKGPAVRSFGKGIKPKNYSEYDFSAKSETLLSLK